MSSSNEMVLQAGLEEIEPGRWLVSVFDMPGCFSAGSSPEAAIEAAPGQVRRFYQWLASKDGGFPDIESGLRVEAVERIPLRGFFEKDARPVWSWDVELAQRVLTWNRQDLLDYLHAHEGHPPTLPAEYPLEKLPEHIYRSELWLLSRLEINLDDLELPPKPWDRMAVVRQLVLMQLPTWVDSDLVCVTDGERWSPRKVVRRLMWHDRDHIPQT